MAAKQSPRRKGAGRTPAPDSRARLFYGILALVAVVGLGWVGYTLLGRSGVAVDPVEVQGLDDPRALVARAEGVSRGPDDASVTVRVFSDFTCPGCRMFAQTTEPLLRSEYVEAGRVRLVYHDLPLGGEGQHRWGFLGARAARCAHEQDRFWDYHDQLFAHQGEWSASRSAPVDRLVEYAGQVGLDATVFRGCLESERYAAVVTANGRLGIELGVSSTPTVFVGSRSVPGWNDWDELREAVERELGEGGA